MLCFSIIGHTYTCIYIHITYTCIYTYTYTYTFTFLLLYYNPAYSGCICIVITSDIAMLNYR